MNGGQAVRPERLALDNGLTVLWRTHAAADVAAVQLWVGVGARHEGEGEAGLSHFIEHLLFKGTPTRAPGVIDQTISALGGEMNAATSQDFTYYHVVLPAGHVGIALEVLADLARRPLFDPGEIDRERLVVVEEMRRAEDNPSAHLWRVLVRQHFPGHPYGQPVLGTPESIRTVPRDSILAYHRRHYVPDNATVVVVGNVDRERMLAEVRQAFLGWEPRDGLRGARDGAGRLELARSITRVAERRALQQSYLGFAWPGPVVPEPDVYAVDLLVSVLGRGRSSRLHQALRERLGLVSGVGAAFYTQHDASMVMVSARTSEARQEAIEQAALVEIARLAEELIGEDELERARTAVEAGYAFGHETAEGVAYGYGSAETVWTLEFELTYLDRVRSVTREAIREAARRYLATDSFTAAVLTPLAETGTA